MEQKKAISFFLLGLLLTVNWHNTFLHSHDEAEQEQYTFVHSHDHDHPHSHHHHTSTTLSIWDWIKKALGDFEHPDMGDSHFELFIRPNDQIGFDQITALFVQPFIDSQQNYYLLNINTLQNSKVPDEVLSFSDPPFPDIISNRGPPDFS